MNNNNNLLNIKRERTKENKEIIVTLERLGATNFRFISDTLQDRTKIKIPIFEDLRAIDSKNGSQADKNSTTREKQTSINIKISVQSIQSNASSLAAPIAVSETSKIPVPEIKASPAVPEEIPLLQKYVEKNQKQPITIPTCTQWFSLDGIHEIETKTLPEFFCGVFPGKTPEVYKEYRNYIINLYRENTNAYLSSSTCRKHLSGDVCSIMRIHAFLEHWGLINFNLEAANKSNNLIIPKTLNFKSPIYLDISTLAKPEVPVPVPNPNQLENKHLDLTSPITIVNETDEIKTVYPLNEKAEEDTTNQKSDAKFSPLLNSNENLSLDSSFKIIFNKNALNTLVQINFLAKNYRPKCDICKRICNIDWYMLRKQEINKDSLLICEVCFQNEKFLNVGYKKEDFEMANFFNIINPSEKFNPLLKERIEAERWNTEETIKLINLIELHGNDWDSILKELDEKRSKNDCILHLLQMPLKSEILCKFLDSKNNTEETKIISESEEEKEDNKQGSGNSVFNQILFFSKMFEKYIESQTNPKSEATKSFPSQDTNLPNGNGKTIIIDPEANEKAKCNLNSTNFRTLSGISATKKDYSNIQSMKELIYKVFTTSVDKAKELQKSQKKKMKKLVSLLIYLQMRKIEMKLLYFNEFEKIIQYESQQLKSKESQTLQERLKLAFKKADVLALSNKFKEITTQFQENEKIELKDLSNIEEINALIEEAGKVRIDNSENLLDLKL